ncbi:MAG: MerR family transcriptional regulator [Armatimonadota bacterium]|nr:MerR family transcriptional regulator [Armatimonadota bacterium]
MPDPGRQSWPGSGAEEADAPASDALGDEPVYVISVAAKLAGLPSWTLRVLDKEGIVRPQRTEKDRRLYSDRDIALLARVRYLTEERGVNINGVKLILEMEGHAAPSRPGRHSQGDPS